MCSASFKASWRSSGVCGLPLLGSSQLHISQYIKKNHNTAGKPVVVVGGGQSGAEVFLELSSKPASQRPERIT
ncbi:hypothetical protein AIY08_05080 [Salmonella enterica]|nr:hypothetical protein [Salmonella enterica]EBP3817269.1 hypothetical protein [Salmonella enterica subsp. enterica]ECP3267770.1 SidA/IucD/PvdA family monooxygenase [Salmonella enterica subsp. enterica serovar [1],13,23:g,z51:-]ECT1271526.1 hypothetical protein [Salmonella enterica subsp. houtenae serovar 48:g,z51:-]EDT2391378.1 SidA/IucD/PvdA family monooxygenase [Salmonella enterica subsp. arizonae]